MTAALAAACGGAHSSSASAPTTEGGGYTLAQAQTDLPVGASRFVFGIVGSGGRTITTGSPQVYVARDTHTPALGPFGATWQAWGPSRGDNFGTPPIPGFFTAQVNVPSAGEWLIDVVDLVGGRRVEATGQVPVVANQVAAVGSHALSEPTPVATTPDAEAKIDTRQPPTAMHYISLDAALANGKPTVLVFATPQLCTSRLCGPVVDEVLTVFEKDTAARANFVDVEIYPSRNPDQPTPAFTKWGFQSEPWVLVIDRGGIIRARFEGPVIAPEIDAALSPYVT